MSELIGTVGYMPRTFNGIRRYFYLETLDPEAIRDNSGRVKCLCKASLLFQTMPVKLTGEYVDGVFECDSLECIYTTKEEVIKYIHTRVKGCGIGVKKIDKMVSLYGHRILEFTYSQLYDLISKDFPGIKVTNVNKFLDLLYKDNPITELEEYLSAYSDISYPVIEKIYAEYKELSVERIKDNPYRECLNFDIRRKVAEKMAHDLHIDMYSDIRICGLISYALKAASSNGHTYVAATDLVKMVSDFSKNSVYRVRIPAIYVANMVTSSGQYLLDTKTGFVSLKYLNNAEINIAMKLKLINNTVKYRDIVTDEMIVKLESDFGLTYADEQRDAFKILADNGISILTGGPGTGKTSTIKGIIVQYLKKHRYANVRLAAPTGRAAKRMSEATGFKATTIHKLLEFRPYTFDVAPKRNVHNPIEADFIIIDEVSMCDVFLLNLLLNAVPKGCRILFVGDENQLPSVGAGNCLHDMIASGCFNVFRLIKNFRSDSSIVNNANLILNGELPIEDGDFIIKKAINEKEAFETVTMLMDHLYDDKHPFECQVIEPSVKGIAGAKKINSYVHKEIVHKNLGDEVSDEMMVGDKIIFNVNCYNYYDTEYMDDDGFAPPEYVNGEIGIIESMDDKEFVFNNGDEKKLLSVSCLTDASLCYSYTIHKSQGSENSIIIICLPDSMSHMMNRNLLYTAITRAKNKVIIVYTGDALLDCVNNKYNVIRNTRLVERLIS